MEFIYMVSILAMIAAFFSGLWYVFHVFRYLTFNPNHMLRLATIRGWSSRADKFVDTWCLKAMQAEFLGEAHAISRERLQALKKLEGMPYKYRWDRNYINWTCMTPEDSQELHDDMLAFIVENSLSAYVSLSED